MNKNWNVIRGKGRSDTSRRNKYSHTECHEELFTQALK